MTDKRIKALAQERAGELALAVGRHPHLAGSIIEVGLESAIGVALKEANKALKQEKLDRSNENEMLWSEISDLRAKRDMLECELEEIKGNDG